MKINETYKQTKYNLTKYVGRKIDNIVIHNTATTASAQNNCKYFAGGNRNASADFFLNKDGSIYQFNGDIKNYYTWEVASGGNGIYNKNSIGIEVVSAGEEFTAAQINSLKELVPYLKKTYGATNLVRHYDSTKKSCPAYYVNNNRWSDLKNKLEQEATSDLPYVKEFKVKIKSSSLNVRSGPGTTYGVVNSVKAGGTYTIVETKGNWGLLKAYAYGRNGWINISDSYVTRV